MAGQLKDEDIIKAARARMAKAVDADLANREAALDDLKNLAGHQWPEDILAEREASNRVVITINRLTQFVRQVTGDLRRLNPAIKVIAGDQEASEDIAELIEGIIRQIEYTSGASSIYEGAAESAAQCGMGAWRVLTEYEDPMSFLQCIVIEPIHNPFAVYWDPAARSSTRHDAMYCFITEEMSKEDFEDAYPDKSMADAEHDGRTDGIQYWHDAGSVVIAEYFWKEAVEKTIYLLPDGSVSDVKPVVFDAVQTRKTTTHKVMWAKVSGMDVLEGPTEMPGTEIPVVAVMGEELYVGGEIIRTSVIRHAKDPQRLYNYWSSAQTEMIALQPKAPFLVTAKQIAGQEDNWASVNDSNDPYLVFTPDEKAPGAPQRSQPPVPSSGMMTEIQKAVGDMEATTGIYAAALGERSNESSGVAIRQRQMESDVSTSIYSDNLGKSIEHCGRIIIGMIPSIYDTDRAVQIIGKDGASSMTRINGSIVDPMQMQQQPILVNPITIGKYDVKVSVGPNYATRRQETAESMLAFIQAVPNAGAVTADLIAKAQDWPDAERFAERLKALLPPGVGDEEDQQDPQAMQQMQMAQQAQMQQEQMAQQAQAALMDADVRKAQAAAAKAEADAQKAQFEAREAQMNFAAREAQIRLAMSQTPIMFNQQ